MTTLQIAAGLVTISAGLGALGWFYVKVRAAMRDGAAIRDVLLGRPELRSRVTGEVTPALEGIGVRAASLEAQGREHTALLTKLVALVGENHERRITALELVHANCQSQPQTVVNVAPPAS